KMMGAKSAVEMACGPTRSAKARGRAGSAPKIAVRITMRTPWHKAKTKASAILVSSVCAARRTPAARETMKVATVMNVKSPTGAAGKTSGSEPTVKGSDGARAHE